MMPNLLKQNLLKQNLLKQNLLKPTHRSASRHRDDDNTQNFS